MAAKIQSKRNGITPIDEASRNDLVVTDVVSLFSIDGATTYNWSIVFAPAGSTATFSGSSTAFSPGSFTVDLVGPYLIRLVVDQSLPTEDTQYVRLRALTQTLSLKLVAAGERRDGSGIIPVDVSTEGWANDQNFNLQTLETATAVVETLAQTLDAGNTTGGNNIIVTSGDIIIGQQGAALGGSVLIRGGTPTSGVAAGGNIQIRPGAGLGGGANGETILQNSLGTFQVGLFVSAADTLQIRIPGGGGLPLVYNATTGKLDVPGLIDPTGVVFSTAVVPTTGATEGAIFVSDGSSGLVNGHLYFRGPGDASPADIGVVPTTKAPLGWSSDPLITTLSNDNGMVQTACTPATRGRLYASTTSIDGNAYTSSVRPWTWSALLSPMGGKAGIFAWDTGGGGAAFHVLAYDFALGSWNAYNLNGGVWTAEGTPTLGPPTAWGRCLVASALAGAQDHVFSISFDGENWKEIYTANVNSTRNGYAGDGAATAWLWVLEEDLP